jgi:hypothetical protein
MSMRRVTAAALLGLTAAAAAGCSGGGGRASNQGAPPAATAPDTGGGAGATTPGGSAGAGTTVAGKTECAKSPSAAVGQALGLAVGPVVASDEGRVTVCAYTGKYEVLVRYQADEDASQFSSDRQSAVRLHQKVTSVAGLGKAAFWAATPPTYTLAARNSDNMAIFITAPATLRSERTLMVELLEKT